MFNTADSVPRADISSVLMEAVGQEGLFVAPQLMPIVPSPLEVGRYPKFTKATGRLLDKAGGAGVTKRNDTGTYRETERKFEWDNYQTEEYGLEERVDDTVARRMANFFDAEMVTGKMIMNEMMLDYEMETAALLNATGTAVPASINYTDANIDTFDVPKDMNALIETLTMIGELPNTIVMSLPVWNRIRRSKLLQTYVYGFLNVNQGGSQITEQMFGAVFGIENVIITKKSVNTAVRGKTPVLAPVWGNEYIIIGQFMEGDWMNGGVGRTPVWEADSEGGLFTSESYRDEKRRGSMLRIRSNRVLKVCNAEAMLRLTTGYAA